MGQWAATNPKGTVPPERQGGGDDHEARGLVQDHGLEGSEAEKSDEQRQRELCCAEPDQSHENADDGTTAEGRREVTETMDCRRVSCHVPGHT
jgi:hypothetical protein